MLVRTQQKLHQDQDQELHLEQDQELRWIRSCAGSGAALGSGSGAALDQELHQELRCIWSCIRSKSRNSSTRRTEVCNEVAWKPMREHYQQLLILAGHHWGA